MSEEQKSAVPEASDGVVSRRLEIRASDLPGAKQLQTKNGSIMQTSGTNPQKHRESSVRLSRKLPACGFLVTDALLKPLFVNPEAIAILTYPGPSPHSLTEAIQKKLRQGLGVSTLTAGGNNGASGMKLKSGRRTYLCHAIPLNGNGGANGNPATLITLERTTSTALALFQISQQFNFTHREQQAVTLLLKGLGNKEIADTMGISSHTVKAFLRMASIKMGVPTRFAIVTKILALLLSHDLEEMA